MVFIMMIVDNGIYYDDFKMYANKDINRSVSYPEG
jgi:hypothetical protein